MLSWRNAFHFVTHLHAIAHVYFDVAIFDLSGHHLSAKDLVLVGVLRRVKPLGFVVGIGDQKRRGEFAVGSFCHFA